MKTFLKVIIFQIGVDCLGFPLFHGHNLIYKESSSIPHRNFHKF